MGDNMAILAAGTGAAFMLRAGQSARVVNTHGTQVVDTWALISAAERLSLEHTREVLPKLRFAVGDVLVTNFYRPILRLAADTSPGIHDTLIAACNPRMFERAGRGGGHPNCADNLRSALRARGIEVAEVPCPLNLFMNTRVTADGGIEFLRPVSRPGDHVELRAESDCVVVFSACPDDVYPTNGGDGSPREVEIRIA